MQKAVISIFFIKVFALQGTGQSLPEQIGKRQEINSDGIFCGADKVVVVPARILSTDLNSLLNVTNLFSSFFEFEKIIGLEKNTAKVNYYKTINVGFNVPDHVHILFPALLKTTNESWYTVNDKFKNQKLIAIAFKSDNSDSNSGYPLFKNWFDIIWPDIKTVAAASVYNTAGSMFPEEKTSVTGIQNILLGANELILDIQLLKMVSIIQKALSVPAIGPSLAITIGTVMVTIKGLAVKALLDARNDKSSPIAKYENAKYKKDTRGRAKGGWLAHLVPINKAGFQH